MKGECAELGSNVYYIGDARQADNYTKTTEVIINYIKKNYKLGNEVCQALETGTDYTFARPESVDSTGAIVPIDPTSVDGLITKQLINRYVDNLEKYEAEKSNAYGLIYGQCTKGLRDKLEQRSDWSTVKNDMLELIKQSGKLPKTIKKQNTHLNQYIFQLRS